MSAPAAPAPEDRVSGGQATLWIAAAAVVAAAHAGGALWALQRPTSASLSDSAPAAVMIDLAPEPVAPEAPEQVITPDAANAPDIPDAAEQPTPPPPTEMAALPAPETPPPPTLAPPEVAEPVADAPPLPEPTLDPPVPAEVAIARPLARPETPPPSAKVEKPDPKPVREVKREQSQAARKAAVEAPSATTAAAPKTSTGGSGAVSPRKWQARLMAHLERRKRYPPGAKGRGEEGVVYVRFSINDAGEVLSAALARSSGFAELDEAVLSLVRRASPVPAPPPGAPHDITAPVHFRIR